MNKKNVLYIGVELDKESQDILRSLVKPQDGWKTRCRQMTIFYNKKRLPEIPLRDYEEAWVDENLGKDITLIGYQVGESDGLKALKVMSRAPKNSYIPLATKEGSREIKNWKIIHPIILTGKIYVWYI